MNISIQPTKASAIRWLTSRIGCEIETAQYRPDGMTWRPGLRMLSRRGKAFYADDSQIKLTPNHVVEWIKEHGFRVDWHDEDGVLIHSTVYTDPIEEGGDDE